MQCYYLIPTATQTVLEIQQKGMKNGREIEGGGGEGEVVNIQVYLEGSSMSRLIL